MSTPSRRRLGLPTVRPDRAVRSVPPLVPRPRPQRVLVVEDQQSVRELLGVVLSAEGLETVTVSSAEDALAALSESSFDLVTIDLMLPGMSGTELSRRLRADPSTSGTAQMIVSASPELLGGDAPHVDAVLQKPFDLAAFSRTVHRLLPEPPAPDAGAAGPRGGLLAVPALPRSDERPDHGRAPAARRRGVARYRSAVSRRAVPTTSTSLSHALDTLVAMAASVSGYPMAMLALLDDTRQYPLAVVGAGFVSEMPVMPLCDLVATGEVPVVVDVVPADQLPADSEVAAYVGVPLFGREGIVVGSLCVLDTRPRSDGQSFVGLLENIAELAQDQLELLRREAELGVVHDTVLIEELRQAIAEGQLEVWYQPVVDLVERRLHGVEALVRWRHPERGLLLPGTFLPAAEDTDLIIELDRAVLRQACLDTVALQETYPDLTVAVNVSGAHVVQEDFADVVQQTLADTGLRPRDLVVELTESALVRTDSVSGRELNRLRGLGARVYLDDFGTGWNSLEQLLRLPADGIKADRLFSAALGSTTGNALATALLGLARDLALDVVVEGLETDAQLAVCLELGGRLGQGHRTGGAMPCEELLGWAAGFEAGIEARSRHRYRD